MVELVSHGRRDETRGGRKKKQLDALLSPTPKDDYEAAKKKWEDNSNVDRFIKETREFLDKLDKEK